MAVESLLRYRFKQKKLLEETLTHPSCTESVSYQRLEFVGDAALGLALTNYVFLKYPGKLSLLRSANISTDKLARVAVRHRLYEYVRRNVTGLDEKVREFVVAVKEEQAIEISIWGLMKAPEVLADIVEWVIAISIYRLCGRIRKEVGPVHQKRYTYSVEIEISQGVLFVIGNKKPKVKMAESSKTQTMYDFLLSIGLLFLIN